MELLLNLSWLLLAMPAFWLWRVSSGVPDRRRLSALQGVFALACALVLLFPVVSATDDLRAMRAEMEESQTSRRSISQSSAERSSASRALAQPALPVSATVPVALECGFLSVVPDSVPTPASLVLIRPGRAPPLPANS
jgi:hypothetical protein